jgi:hypothetical protein
LSARHVSNFSLKATREWLTQIDAVARLSAMSITALAEHDLDSEIKIEGARPVKLAPP